MDRVEIIIGVPKSRGCEISGWISPLAPSMDWSEKIVQGSNCGIPMPILGLLPKTLLVVDLLRPFCYSSSFTLVKRSLRVANTERCISGQPRRLHFCQRLKFRGSRVPN